MDFKQGALNYPFKGGMKHHKGENKLTDFFPFKKSILLGLAFNDPLFLNDTWHDINFSQLWGWWTLRRTLPMVTGALGAFVVAWKVAHEAARLGGVW